MGSVTAAEQICQQNMKSSCSLVDILRTVAPVCNVRRGRGVNVTSIKPVPEHPSIGVSSRPNERANFPTDEDRWSATLLRLRGQILAKANLNQFTALLVKFTDGLGNGTTNRRKGCPGNCSRKKKRGRVNRNR